jgi:hypothetical protein
MEVVAVLIYYINNKKYYYRCNTLKVKNQCQTREK